MASLHTAARLAACALIVVAATMHFGASAAASDSPQAIAVTGSCLFGTGSGNVLTATFSPPVAKLSGSLISISGQGMCTSNVSSNAVALNLTFNTSPWTCAAGAGVGGGSASWSDGVPQPENALSATASGAGASLNVSLQDPTLRFQASASLVWAPGAMSACVTTGVSSVSLSGVMSFASS